MAVDVMEEQAYDPIRAVASLSPASLLCPAGAMRVLGGGCIGVVFLEEETGNVVKVMIEDFAKKEYDIFCAFADAGIAPRPIDICGPCVMPAGPLFSIRMEAVTHTLQGVLNARAPRGPRHGLTPLDEDCAQRIGSAVVVALQRMLDRGLVHGDFHLENIGLKNPYAQPLAQVIDFGRSASTAGFNDERQTRESFYAGHEYDVFRLIEELIASFENLQYEVSSTAKECEKELRELKRTKEVGAPDAEHQLHHSRQIAGLQAYLSDEPKALEQAEVAYNVVLGAVVGYACAKLDLSFDGTPSVGNRRMRQAASKRQRACFHGYFKSDLFWGGTTAN